MAEEAAKRLCEENPKEFAITACETGQSVQVTNLKSNGVLEMEVGNLLDVKAMETVDIVLLETDLSANIYLDLCHILRKMKRGSRAFTYLDLRKIWEVGAFPFKQLDINRPITDRYSTSWSVNRGHHFFLWGKVLDSDTDELPATVGDLPWEADVSEGGGAVCDDHHLDHHGYPIPQHHHHYQQQHHQLPSVAHCPVPFDSRRGGPTAAYESNVSSVCTCLFRSSPPPSFH